MADPVTEFELYRDELLAALADDDPVAVLRATLDEVPRLVATASTEQLSRSPAPGEWSPRQVLNHLSDSDLVTGHAHPHDRDAGSADDRRLRPGRLDGTIRQPGRDPPGDRRPLADAAARQPAAVRIVAPEEWDRVGLHSERGAESVRLTSSFRRATIACTSISSAADCPEVFQEPLENVK